MVEGGELVGRGVVDGEVVKDGGEVVGVLRMVNRNGGSRE